MKKAICLMATAAGMFFGSGQSSDGAQVPFTLEDRDRLIKIETSLQEFKEAVDRRFEQIDKRFEQVDKRFEQIDKRFEQVDKRFEQMMTFLWILAGVFTGLVTVTIGFAIWDRRSALDPVLRRNRELEDREERIENALKDLAQDDPKVAAALKHWRIL